MASEGQGNEKRRHKRYTISGGVFALLKWNGSEILGSIMDISAGGFSLSHIDEDEDLKDLSRVAINLISGQICQENLAGRTIWTQKETGGFRTAMVKMKHRGIMFEQQNNALQLQLQDFIDSLITK